MRRISNEGLEHLIKTEGVRYQIYDDKTGRVVSSFSQVRGYPTIGVGHRIYPEAQASYAKYLGGKRKLSQYQVMELLRKDVQKFEDRIQKRIGDKAPMTQSMWDAIISLAFNAGANASSVKKASEAVKHGNYKAAANAILNGPVKSRGVVRSGLVKRRRAEAKLFMKDGLPGGIGIKIAGFTGVGALIALSTYYSIRFAKQLRDGKGDLSLTEKLNLMKSIDK